MSETTTPPQVSSQPAPDGRLRLAIATPLPPAAEAVLRAEPRIELLFDPELLPPQRYPSDHWGQLDFTRTPEQEERLDALLSRADAVYGVPGERPDQVARVCAPGVRWVALTAAGGGSLVARAHALPTGGIDDAVLERVAFTTSAGVHARPLAEFALMGLLTGFQRVPELRADQAKHHWGVRGPFPVALRGARVLIAGLGHLGRELGDLLRGLGAHVTGTSRHLTHSPHADVVVHPDQLAEAAANADALVVTLPGTELTRHLVSREVLEALPRGATVVNIGRGTVIDEEALTQLLASSHVGFAALDVFAQEPLPSGSELWEMDNVLVSPHTATMNRDEDRLIAEILVDNARRILNGEDLRNRVNTHEFY